MSNLVPWWVQLKTPGVESTVTVLSCALSTVTGTAIYDWIVNLITCNFSVNNVGRIVGQAWVDHEIGPRTQPGVMTR